MLLPSALPCDMHRSSSRLILSTPPPPWSSTSTVTSASLSQLQSQSQSQAQSTDDDLPVSNGLLGTCRALQSLLNGSPAPSPHRAKSKSRSNSKPKTKAKAEPLQRRLQSPVQFRDASGVVASEGCGVAWDLGQQRRRRQQQQKYQHRDQGQLLTSSTPSGLSRGAGNSNNKRRRCDDDDDEDMKDYVAGEWDGVGDAGGDCDGDTNEDNDENAPTCTRMTRMVNTTYQQHQHNHPFSTPAPKRRRHVPFDLPLGLSEDDFYSLCPRTPHPSLSCLRMRHGGNGGNGGGGLGQLSPDFVLPPLRRSGKMGMNVNDVR